MEKFDQSTLVVFDLDDTLYAEDLYHDSGLEAVSELLGSVFKIDCRETIFKLKREGVTDIFGAICAKYSLPISIQESLLWTYRLHRPEIRLSSEVKLLIDDIASSTGGVAILTDGRAVTQRLKIKSLGLDHIPVYISEEWGSVKPEPKRFNKIMSDFSMSHFVYIGDNPKKDFVTPNNLGWLTLGLKGNDRNVHSQDCADLSQEYHPERWLSSLEELREYLC